MPSPDQVRLAVETMKKLKVNHLYFFEKNPPPEWIEPLLAAGYFKRPPMPEDREGMRWFPRWPDSEYLARIAAASPDLVFDVLHALPSTDNIYVHGDIVNAALQLRPEQAARLARKECAWIASQPALLWLLPDRYAGLVVRLMETGQENAAFELVRAMLEPLPDPRFTEMSDVSDDVRRFVRPEPRARLEVWDYQQAVKSMRPALVSADGSRTLRLFTELLATAMKLSARPGQPEDGDDYSYIWRPAIEEHRQNDDDHSIREVLISTVRDVANDVVREGSMAAADVVALLEEKPWSVFHRVALHVLAQHGDKAQEIVFDRLASWEIFDDLNLRHEYVQLARAYARLVPDARMRDMLSHLRTPPDGEAYRRNILAISGREPTDEEIAQSRLGWERDHLAALDGLLPQDWQIRYDELAAELGRPRHPDMPSYSESWSGPTSPKSSDDLASMETDELIEFIRGWHGSGDPFAESAEGLGRQLTAAVEADPNRFAPVAEQFAVLEPTYVRSILNGFESALRRNASFAWPRVIDLCRHVAAQRIEDATQPDFDETFDRDRGWRWSRGAAVRLLAEGCSRNDGTIPIEHRPSVWEVISRVTRDPEPTPEHEHKYGGNNMDPANLSINTTRGNAIHAVVRYALWVRRDDQSTSAERVAQGMDAMPEVREVLESHLDPSVDSALSIRAVYGQWLPWLVLLDRGWVETQRERIFPSDPAARPLRDAAWETYITYCAVFDAVFEVLRAEYASAVEALPTATPTTRRRLEDPAAKLGEHLMVLYMRGRLTWDNEGGMLGHFFDVAPQEVRASAMEFVGRLLYNGNVPATGEVLDRLKELWRRRMDAYLATPHGHEKEIAAFSWWFASKYMPLEWTMPELLRVLDRGESLEGAHLVLERLAEVSSRVPLDALRALDLLVTHQATTGHLYAWHDSTRSIIAGALSADQPAVWDLAARILNALAARGYREFDDLAASVSSRVQG